MKKLFTVPHGLIAMGFGLVAWGIYRGTQTGVIGARALNQAAPQKSFSPVGGAAAAASASGG